MRQTILNPRVWAITALFAVAVVTLVSEPTAQTFCAWTATFLISKTIGIAAAAAFITLANRWRKQGKLGKLGDAINNVEE